MADEAKSNPQDLNSDDLSPRASEGIPTGIRSLRDLIDQVTGRNLGNLSEEGDSGLAELWPFPFLALVGQTEMKLGLLLALINPAVGGVLLIGPRGTGKTTAVRSLIDLLPSVAVSNCYYGCLEEEVEVGGTDVICPNCIEKLGRGESLSSLRPARLVELPLNAALEDVIGSVNVRAAAHDRMRIKRGILSYADKNILYIDEVNLLKDDVTDVILDASAQGSYSIRRGSISAIYRSRFTLIGTMNPEEGGLRPQIMDRFGLRLLVRGLAEPDDRLEAYHRSQAHFNNPRKVVDLYADETIIARDEIQAARDNLPKVVMGEEVTKMGLKLIEEFNIISLRAEITLFESARALAAAANRTEVCIDDLRQVAPMALRLRRSKFITKYFHDQTGEENEISDAIEKLPKEK